MSPLPYDPNWKPQADGAGPTDLASLMTAPDPAPCAGPGEATDFVSLKQDGFARLARAPVHRTAADYLIDALTPFAIFAMVYSVVFFLLDVRYVYTAVHDANLRIFAFCLIMGVVALNRVMARDNSAEGPLYFALLAVATVLYTIGTTSMYEVGSVARHFLDEPWTATGFNTAIALFLWWVVNRLTHECCVDENKVAGDVGMVTGTAKRLEALLQRGAGAKPAPRRAPEPLLYKTIELEAFDPLEGVPRVELPPPERPSLAARLPRRHPGASIFVFSIPALAVFAIGLPVVRHGGPSWVRAGELYMTVYTATALALLMLTSLAGLRQYFRQRGIAMPPAIGVFWVSLGTVMIAAVIAGAAQLPRPELPPLAYITGHERDMWDRGRDTFELSPFSAAPAEAIAQARFAERLGDAVLAVLAVFFAYAALKTLEWTAYQIARRPEHFPRLVVRVFAALSRTLQRLLRLPRLPSRTRARRIDPAVATCAAYRNSLGDPAAGERMGVTGHIEHAYDALCALARDLGVPRGAGQTPNEFINAFPRELRALQDDARELTRLYVLAAYSPMQLDAQVLDRVRAFWMTYERVRARVVR